MTLPYACGWALGVWVCLISVQYYHISRTSRPEKVITCSVLLSPVLFHSFSPDQLRQRAVGIYFPSVDLRGPRLWQAIKKSEEKNRSMCQCVSAHMNVKEKAVNVHTFMWDFSQPWYKQYRPSISALLLLEKNYLFLCTKCSWASSHNVHRYTGWKKEKLNAIWSRARCVWISPPARFDLNQFNCFVYLLFQDLNKSLSPAYQRYPQVW